MMAAENTQEQNNRSDEALATIGEAYYRGLGVKVNYSEAFRYYKKAAEMGNIPALRRMGSCYELGRGVKKNMAEALSCYEDASARGDVTATYKVGDFYWNGVQSLLQKDVQKAADYYIEAFQLLQAANDVWNAPDVYLRIADCLYNGIGTDVDYRNAYDFYCSATDGFMDRMDAGDMECEDLLERAEKGEELCRTKLGLKEDGPGNIQA
ncbi:MAG: sel1 repeat family protein [Solobacterium sp.]|jgi:TPR repeat protein|nr:sel1 repeat family protein [Solobacterium sp.]MDD7680022.1 tetratricopeptide repeat protein [Stecheria intestinalis]